MRTSISIGIRKYAILLIAEVLLYAALVYGHWVPWLPSENLPTIFFVLNILVVGSMITDWGFDRNSDYGQEGDVRVSLHHAAAQHISHIAAVPLESGGEGYPAMDVIRTGRWVLPGKHRCLNRQGLTIWHTGGFWAPGSPTIYKFRQLPWCWKPHFATLEVRLGEQVWVPKPGISLRRSKFYTIYDAEPTLQRSLTNLTKARASMNPPDQANQERIMQLEAQIYAGGYAVGQRAPQSPSIREGQPEEEEQ